MKASIAVLLAGAAFSLLAACQKTPEADTASTGANPTDPTPGSSTGVSTAPPGGSVALPADKAPASDAAIAPNTASSGNSGDANSPTQANPAELKKEQEQAAMPQSGQVNNHSVPETVGTTKPAPTGN